MSAVDPLQDWALFVEVARTLNISRAAARLGMPVATLSRRLAAMEERLSLKLFERTTRKVALTEKAAQFYAHCEPIVDAAARALEAVKAANGELSGCLRLSMPVDLGRRYLAPLLTTFARANRQVRFEVDLSSRLVDLHADAVDIAIRIGTLQDNRLIARQIGVIEQGLFASPAYLKSFGVPRQLGDLTSHQLLAVRFAMSSNSQWRLTTSSGRIHDVRVNGRFRANNIGLVTEWAMEGFGVAMLPSHLVAAEVTRGELVRILPRVVCPKLPVYAVTASRMQSVLIQKFVEHLSGKLGDELERRE